MNRCSVERKWRTVSLESWRKIYIAWNNATIQQRKHAISDVILRDRRRIGKWIVSELLWQNALGLVGLISATLADSQFLKLDVADTTLCTAILELVWRLNTKLLPDQVVTITVLRITSQEGVLLFSHEFLNSLVYHIVRQGRGA